MFIKIFILITVFILIFTYAILYLNTRHPRYFLTTTPAELGIQFEQISFKSNDQIRLKGWFIPAVNNPEAPTIIIAHGLGASKSDFVNLSGVLCKNGFNVLLFDFRAHGESSGKSCSLGLKEQKDISAAVDYVLSRPDVINFKIGLYGFSLGGATGIIEASNNHKISAVAADTPFASLKRISEDVIKRSYRLPSFPFIPLANIFYRLSFNGWMGQVSPSAVIHKISPRPILLISSDVDEMTPLYHAKELFNNAADPKELWIIEGASHGGTISADKEKYNRKLLAFFSQALK